MPPTFPVVEGDYQLTPEWKITLPGKFRRRIEEKSLVLWRPGLGIYFDREEDVGAARAIWRSVR